MNKENINAIKNDKTEKSNYSRDWHLIDELQTFSSLVKNVFQ